MLTWKACSESVRGKAPPPAEFIFVSDPIISSTLKLRRSEAPCIAPAARERSSVCVRVASVPEPASSGGTGVARSEPRKCHISIAECAP